MAAAADKKRWDDLHAAQAKAQEIEDEYERELRRKYGYEGSWRSWIKKGERDKLERLEAKTDKIGDKIIELLVKVSPRGEAWLSGAPSWWIRQRLTWDDAIRPANEPLSVVVPGSYGNPDGTVRSERGNNMSRVRNRRQPSLPGFPDIPEKLEIRIPTMPWEQIGGDMDPGAYGGLIATADGDHIELLEIQPVAEYVGNREAADVGFPFWTKEAWFDLEDLDPKNEDVKSALASSGFDEGEQKIWLEEEATPEQRALVIAESLLRYGRGDEGPSGWSSDLPDHEVKWNSGKIATIPDYLADEDESFRDDVLGYSDIRSSLETKVEEMANQSSAQAWSTVGDQAANDAEKDGFDPESLVGVAEFGEAVAVNGDIETDKTMEGVEADLEKEGYELTDVGGKVPAQEGYADPEAVIRAVAREMKLDEDVVEEAAKGIDWWPKSGGEEIASSTSGWANVWGKKNPDAHVEDGDYVVQGSWSDGRISEEFGMNDEKAAVAAAKKLLKDPTFEGDSVRVITRDGELVWSSKPEGTEEARRRRPARRRGR
jgi:hypothetical protein